VCAPSLASFATFRQFSCPSAQLASLFARPQQARLAGRCSPLAGLQGTPRVWSAGRAQASRAESRTNKPDKKQQAATQRNAARRIGHAATEPPFWRAPVGRRANPEVWPASQRCAPASVAHPAHSHLIKFVPRGPHLVPGRAVLRARTPRLLALGPRDRKTVSKRRSPRRNVCASLRALHCGLLCAARASCTFAENARGCTQTESSALTGSAPDKCRLQARRNAHWPAQNNGRETVSGLFGVSLSLSLSLAAPSPVSWPLVEQKCVNWYD